MIKEKHLSVHISHKMTTGKQRCRSKVEGEGLLPKAVMRRYSSEKEKVMIKHKDDVGTMLKSHEVAINKLIN